MIDFSLSDDQKSFQELARKFAKEEIIPKAAHHDRRRVSQSDIEKSLEIGLMNTHIPQEYGGLGLGVIDGCIITEELAYGCTGVCTAMEANTLAAAPLIVAGNEEQKKEFLGHLLLNRFTPLTVLLNLERAQTSVESEHWQKSRVRIHHKWHKNVDYQC